MDSSEDKSFPRVLVISSAPIGSLCGTGITLGNLFRGWPADRIRKYSERLQHRSRVYARGDGEWDLRT